MGVFLQVSKEYQINFFFRDFNYFRVGRNVEREYAQAIHVRVKQNNDQLDFLRLNSTVFLYIV